MRAEGNEGPDLRAVRRRLGGSAFNGLALVLIATPFYVAWSWRAGVDDAAFDDPAQESRLVVGAEVLEMRTSDGFAELADDVARAAKPPGWEAVRDQLEARGRKDLWYSVRVEWRLDDGAREEMTYVRHPYHDREHHRELLRIVRGDDDAKGRGRATFATFRAPGSEDQGPIPNAIIERLRIDRPWAD